MMSDLISSTVSVSGGSRSAILPRLNRTVGAEIVTAAIADPFTPRTAMPTATTPRSLSWILVPNPCRRTIASVRFRALSPASSSASPGCSRATSSNGRSASRTLPPEVSRAASLDPDPAAHPQRLLGLDRVDELDVGADQDDQVGRLAGLLGQPDQVRPGDAEQRGRGTGAAAQVGERAAGPVRAVAGLLDEAAEPEHGDEPVRGGPGHPELGRRLAHPQHAVALQDQQQLQRVVDGLNGIRRGVILHYRTITVNCSALRYTGLA